MRLDLGAREPAPDWLAKLESRIAQSEERAIGGRSLNRLGDNPFSQASESLLEAFYAFSNRKPDEAAFFASNNLTICARSFREVGGFDEGFARAAAEDREFCDRWRYFRKKMIYAPEIVIYHAHHHDFRSFLRQHFNYGRGAVRYHALRAQRGSGRMRDDVGFHVQLVRWLRSPMSRLPFRQRAAVLGLILLSQVIYATGYSYQRLRLESD